MQYTRLEWIKGCDAYAWNLGYNTNWNTYEEWWIATLLDDINETMRVSSGKLHHATADQESSMPFDCGLWIVDYGWWMVDLYNVNIYERKDRTQGNTNHIYGRRIAFMSDKLHLYEAGRHTMAYQQG